MTKETGVFYAALSKAQILNTVPSGLFLVDQNRHIVYWNPEAERLTGYTAAEVVGQHCSVLEGIECGTGCGLFDTGAPEKPIMAMECRIRTKSGAALIISKNIDLLRLRGRVVGGIETFIDITAPKQLEQKLRCQQRKLEQTVADRTAALQEERSRLRSILDSMTDMAYIVTADYRIDFFNKAMADHFGIPSGACCYRTIHGIEDPCRECPMAAVRAGRTVIEERQFVQDGQTYEVIHSPVQGVDGEIQKLAVCRDITSRKELEEQLKESNQQLDAFVHTVSHDLRSPLTPILGYAEFLRDNYRDQLDERGLDLVEEIHSQGHRILRMVEDLLELSQVGHAERPEKPIKTRRVVNQILKENAAEVRDKQIRITIADLPDLRIPESLLSQLFSNLVLNAIRYGCDRGGAIEITGNADSKTTTFAVIDHGPGIDDTEAERVFKIFYRGRQAAGVPGSGIGLATVAKIVRLFDGEVTVKQTPGGGCTMQVVFPVAN
ncbi:MAG: PAS domain S-box protein [Desulfuromonadales bacterium]